METYSLSPRLPSMRTGINLRRRPAIADSAAQVQLPGFGPPRLRRGTAHIRLRSDRLNIFVLLQKQGPPCCNGGLACELVLLFTSLLAAALARQSFLNAL